MKKLNNVYVAPKAELVELLAENEIMYSNPVSWNTSSPSIPIS